jgi:hypothetical protein
MGKRPNVGAYVAFGQIFIGKRGDTPKLVANIVANGNSQHIGASLKRFSFWGQSA